jgi:hypothetical protein
VKKQNQVTGAFSAFVYGKITGLAGCAGHSFGCEMPCLRADINLIRDHSLMNLSAEQVADCKIFIPVDYE